MESTSNTAIMAQKYQSIINLTKGMTFSWAVSVRLVGGKKRLERLMLEGKINYSKSLGAANTKWKFAACDVLSNIKPVAHR